MNVPITIVTGNPGKAREIEALAPKRLVFTMLKLDLPEIQSIDREEILTLKLEEAFKQVSGPVIVEDVSAGLDRPNGLPGPFFKFFENSLGARALPSLTQGPGERATVICTAGYYDGAIKIIVEGELHGMVVEPRGDNGFGFDPSIVPEGEERTLAEMSSAEKNAISHRSQAFKKLFTELLEAGLLS